MIPPELVRARRRGEALLLSPLTGADREAAEHYAEELLLGAAASVGQSQDELDEALDAIERPARHDKLFGALKKLVADDCSFEAPLELDPVLVRRAVFTKSAAERRTLAPGEPFSRSGPLAEVARELGTTPDVVEEALYADLRGAQKVTRVPEASPAHVRALIERYRVAEIQAVLLRAVKVTVTVRSSSAAAYRRLFRRIKFRRLLYVVEALADGRYRIDIDGPFSMFESVTRYGMALAQLVPVLGECDEAALAAELRWGKERRALSFTAELGGGAELPAEVHPELDALLEALRLRRADGKSPYEAELAERVFDLPGVGVVVPDLVLSRAGEPDVYVELLGYWSRDAVWRRIEWAEASAKTRVAPKDEPPRMVFAVSSRLRVSEAVLPKETSAALYVYKGVPSAKGLLECVSAALSS